ncbi:MAG: murein L,D-transpeptidase, partial [Bacteroides sp.]
MKKIVPNSLLILILFCSCISNANEKQVTNIQQETDSLVCPDSVSKMVTEEMKPEDIEISKELLYDKHTLADTYPYKDTTRHFQWEKMKERLAL